jgi:hypothetical protein
MAGTEAVTSLEELEAVVVYGQRFEEQVLESESRFYRLYNELNTADDFDVSCDYYWFEDRSLRVFAPGVPRRGCVPMYFAEAVADNWSWQAAMHSCVTPSSSTFGGSAFADSTRIQYGDGGSVGYVPMANFATGFYNGSCATSSAPAPPEAQLVYLSRRAEFVTNLARVMGREATLRELAFAADSQALEGTEHLKAAREARRLLASERKCVPAGSPRGGMTCARR